MDKNDLGGHNGQAVVGERIPHERPVLTVGREDVPGEVDVIVAKDEPTPSFVYEAPSTSSLTKTLCLRPIGDNGELVEVELRLHDPNGFGEDRPYLRAESIDLPWERCEALGLWLARLGDARKQARLRALDK
jgi:hypothetical protein